MKEPYDPIAEQEAEQTSLGDFAKDSSSSFADAVRDLIDGNPAGVQSGMTDAVESEKERERTAQQELDETLWNLRHGHDGEAIPDKLFRESKIVALETIDRWLKEGSFEDNNQITIPARIKGHEKELREATTERDKARAKGMKVGYEMGREIVENAR